MSNVKPLNNAVEADERSKSFLKWMAIVLLGILTIVGIYKLITGGESPYLMFSIAMVMCSSAFRDTRLFRKYRALPILAVCGAVGFLLVEIWLAAF